MNHIEPQVKEAMALKAKQIRKAMDAKDKSMAIMAAGRDATLMATAFYPEEFKNHPQHGEGVMERMMKEKIKEWRNWFYYEIYTRDPDDDLLEERKQEEDPF